MRGSNSLDSNGRGWFPHPHHFPNLRVQSINETIRLALVNIHVGDILDQFHESNFIFFYRMISLYQGMEGSYPLFFILC